MVRAIQEYPLQEPVLDVGAGDQYGHFEPHFLNAELKPYLRLDQDVETKPHFKGTAGGGWKLPQRFPTIILMSVLEHEPHPEKLVNWTLRHLAPGGHLLLAVPACWSEHHCPQDYWRILPDGVRHLLRNVKILELVDERGDGEFSHRNQLFAVGFKPIGAK